MSSRTGFNPAYSIPIIMILQGYYFSWSAFRSYRLYLKKVPPDPSPEAIQNASWLINDLKSAITIEDARIIDFAENRFGAGKGMLLDDKAMFELPGVFGAKYSVYSPSQVSIIKQRKMQGRKLRYRASFRFGDLEFAGKISKLSWDRYLAWKGGAQAEMTQATE